MVPCSARPGERGPGQGQLTSTRSFYLFHLLGSCLRFLSTRGFHLQEKGAFINLWETFQVSCLPLYSYNTAFAPCDPAPYPVTGMGSHRTMGQGLAGYSCSRAFSRLAPALPSTGVWLLLQEL